jgi:hypothetical protein
MNVELSALAVPEGYSKWPYAFGQPLDCLKTQDVHDDAGNSYAYEKAAYYNGPVESNIILTGIDVAFLRYTAKITNPELFDSQFIEAFALLLAKELAWPITKSHATEQTMFQKYQLAIPKAQTADAGEQEVSVVTEDPYIDARLSQ